MTAWTLITIVTAVLTASVLPGINGRWMILPRGTGAGVARANQKQRNNFYALHAINAALLLTGCVGTREGTYAAHGADLASTGVGLAMGAAEANPLGVIGIPIKIAITEHIKTLPEDYQPQAYAALSAITWGAVGNNACVIAGLATGGVLMPACIAIGVGTGVTFWQAAEKERNRQWLIAWCAEWVKQGPEYTCDLGDS